MEYLQGLTNVNNASTIPNADDTTATTITTTVTNKLQCSNQSSYNLKKKLIPLYITQIQTYYNQLKIHPPTAIQLHQPIDYPNIELIGLNDLLIGDSNRFKVLIVKVLLGLHSTNVTNNNNNKGKQTNSTTGSNTSNSNSTVDDSTAGEVLMEYHHAHAESSYLVMDCQGNYAITSIYNIGTNVSLCDSHISSNCIFHICHPIVRSNGNNSSNSLPLDKIPIIQVLDVTTIHLNNKPITTKKIATTVLNISSYDS